MSGRDLGVQRDLRNTRDLDMNQMPHGGYVLRKGSWRPTTSHEYVFQMTKSSDYFSDGEAVREPHEMPQFYARQDGEKATRYHSHNPATDGKRFAVRYNNPAGRNLRSVWTIPSSPSTWEYCSGCGMLYEGKERSKIIKVKDGEETVRFCPVCYQWDSWEAHFASYPQALVETPLKASTSEAGCCPICGAAWARVIDKKPGEIVGGHQGFHAKGNLKGMADMSQNPRFNWDISTLGFRPTCTCGEQGQGTSNGRNKEQQNLAPAVPMRVLDPFCGSGTTGIVAKKMGLDFVGIDVKPVYADISRQRIEKAPGADRQTELF